MSSAACVFSFPKHLLMVFLSRMGFSPKVREYALILSSNCKILTYPSNRGLDCVLWFLEDVWKSDLDFLNQNEVEDMVIRPIGGDNGLSDFVKRVSPLTAKQGGLRLEFINYAMALFIFSIRYAQVFWSCHKKFAIILGLQQIINSAHTLISFSTLIVLYKVHVASVYSKSTPFLLDSQMTLLIFGIALTVLFLSSSVLYYLGYLKYMAFLQEKIYDKSLNYSGESSSSFYGYALNLAKKSYKLSQRFIN